jgi:hypothetical protein
MYNCMVRKWLAQSRLHIQYLLGALASFTWSRMEHRADQDVTHWHLPLICDFITFWIGPILNAEYYNRVMLNYFSSMKTNPTLRSCYSFCLLTYLLTYLSTELSPSWEAANFVAIEEIPSNVKEPEGSSPCSQEPSTNPYPKPVQSNPYHPILSSQDSL